MSIRTIVEINHDYGHVIQSNPEQFIRLLKLAINSGSQECWERLESFGIRFGVSAHHSTPRHAGTEHQTKNF